MPRKYTEEFKRDAVALVFVQGLPQKQVCRDLGVSKSALQVWVKNAELEGRGFTPTADPEDRREMLQAMKRIQELEMENEVLRWAAAYLSQANLKLGATVEKMMFPLVRDLAAAGAPVRVPVAVACGILGFSKQAYYQWRADPVSQRDWDDAHLANAALDIHVDDPCFGYRFIADELTAGGFGA